MKQRIELVVFDMAGTTVNEGNVVYKTVQKVINDEGFNVSLEDVLKYGAGKEKHQAITDVLKEYSRLNNVSQIADAAFSKFKIALKNAYDILEIKTFEGTEQLFKDLKASNIKVVLNTGYDSKTAHLLLEKLGWIVGETIDGLITADDVENGRPEGDMILLAMKNTGVNNAEKVMKVGDSAIDVEEGKNANCGITIGVLTGAQNRTQIQEANPTYIIENLNELRAILL
ncbi:phosphonatase-like hydrolase [Flavobacterium sp. RSP49]|uniref:phosphonatase-like hydrolase n=1 Tax=unclassified Flavobacterium TaxID=196869 RepID=UPI000F827C36|nr:MULTISPECIES: phosphonatase-like hydrolase [unclassified Flavobacterium]RTY86255.1 phosphonatase-like hydrolase [Flavobacterium sp. RSP15]RTY99429.1 phosphonatase-like hydrolase [Flavobacterium sp. RSP49]